VSTKVRCERRGRAAWITLDSPETRNALSATLVEALAGHLAQAMEDASLRAVVLTGAGRAFCSGADLGAAGGGVAREGGRGGRSPFVRVLRLLREGPKPVVCAVNGHAFGGGVGLVAASDVVVAADTAQFAFSEVRLGLIPAMISVVVLPKLGEHQARRLFVTGERFDAARAEAYGLVHRVVPAAELAAAAESEVDAIAQGGPRAVAEAKRLVREVARRAEDDAFAWAEAKIAELFASEEAAEGMAAFRAKRPPRWAAEDA
jgi:methylglutaconyl-CoA hydratase